MEAGTGISKWYGVTRDKSSGKWYFVAKIMRKGEKLYKTYPYTEEGARDAAKAVDMFLIRKGYEPVNILKRKNG